MNWSHVLAGLVIAYFATVLAIMVAVTVEACKPIVRNAPEPRPKSMLGRRRGYVWRRRKDGTYYLSPMG